MMGLDPFGLVPVGRGRFDHIGIDGPLHQEARLAKLPGLLLEQADKPFADDLALLFRFADALQRTDELRGGIHRDQFNLHLLAEGCHHLFPFVLSEQARIHENAYKLVAQGAVHQGSRHGRIHSAADGGEHTFGAHLLTHALHGVFDDGERGPIRGRPANLNSEMPDKLSAVERMPHLGVELNPEVPPVHISHCGERAIVRASQRNETLRHARDAVAMRHPDLREAR